VMQRCGVLQAAAPPGVLPVRPRRTSFDLRGWQASDTTKQDCFALTVMLFYPADMCTTCQGCWPR
jgi:hypothetical protein